MIGIDTLIVMRLPTHVLQKLTRVERSILPFEQSRGQDALCTASATNTHKSVNCSIERPTDQLHAQRSAMCLETFKSSQMCYPRPLTLSIDIEHMYIHIPDVHAFNPYCSKACTARQRNRYPCPDTHLTACQTQQDCLRHPKSGEQTPSSYPSHSTEHH